MLKYLFINVYTRSSSERRDVHNAKAKGQSVGREFMLVPSSRSLKGFLSLICMKQSKIVSKESSENPSMRFLTITSECSSSTQRAWGLNFMLEVIRISPIYSIIYLFTSGFGHQRLLVRRKGKTLSSFILLSDQ